MSARVGPAGGGRVPVGAEVVDRGTRFRVWAPSHRRVDVVIEGRGPGPSMTGELEAERGEREGYFSGIVEDVGAGARYRFRLGGGGEAFPDPASRYQPEGPHGPSEVVDPSRYAWGDGGWGGITLRGQVIYEMHVGTFTREGTWAAATERLETLRDVCTTIEMMPVAEFAGDFGWGYDGVSLFAPSHLYGKPDDLRAFVDRAHALGLGVILDVVYNHLGPDGNYLGRFSEHYFSTRHATEWGAAINFDGDESAGTREFFVANAGYWIDEFHFDGLRLDATQSIYDDTTPHVIAEIGETVAASAKGRGTVVIAENEPQETRLVRPRAEGGYGLDAVWNDDFHHSARVALTGRAEAYFSDHRGTPQEFVSAVKHGYLFQGQHYFWQKKRRGKSTRGAPPERFVNFLENHDQVANSARGARLHTSAHPGRMRALKALVMLAPGTPMIFQGEEFASSAPFLYFAHHASELAAAVRKGRVEFLSQFPSIAIDAVRAGLDDPADPATFLKCKLDPAERGRNIATLALHRDLLAVRRNDPTIRAQGEDGLDGAVLGPHAFVIRLFGPGRDDRCDRLLIVNLGVDLHVSPAPEPLLAPPEGTRWTIVWSSEDPRYGGDGMPPPDADGPLRLAGESAVLLGPGEASL
jgi:maltooligosyltrehalose trehalohydrolase